MRRRKKANWPNKKNALFYYMFLEEEARKAARYKADATNMQKKNMKRRTFPKEVAKDTAIKTSPIKLKIKATNVGLRLLLIYTFPPRSSQQR